MGGSAEMSETRLDPVESWSRFDESVLALIYGQLILDFENEFW
jgi:hypothetical protein